jgi:hypothetical protein
MVGTVDGDMILGSINSNELFKHYPSCPDCGSWRGVVVSLYPGLHTSSVVFFCFVVSTLGVNMVLMFGG